VSVPIALVTLAFSADSTKAASIQITWKDNSTNEIGFRIQRLVGTTFVEIGQVGQNVQSYTDQNLTAGVSYCYRVIAYNAAVTSNPSNQACATALGSVTPPPSNPPPGGSPPPPSSNPTNPNSWKDYRLTAKIRSNDNDTIGVMFRYRDPNNFYRFIWNQETPSRKLIRVKDGVATVLASNTVPYKTGQTYRLEINAQGSALKVLIDGQVIFSVTDSNITQGTVAMFSYYNQGTIFDDVLVEDPSTGAVLLWDDFADPDLSGWTIMDETAQGGPSAWSVVNGMLVQNSNIGQTVGIGLGTLALFTNRAWTNYDITLKIRSQDDDSIGVVFRYVDSNNYYRFVWNKELRGRQLVKREKGIFKVLASDGVRYVTNQTYQVEISARDNNLTVRVNGAVIFSLQDASFSQGTIALYSCLNVGSVFDDILVEDTNGTVLLWEDFNDGKMTGWTVFDDAGAYYKPSAWSAATGSLVQQSNIGLDPNLGTVAVYTP
jgi:hypothetical protein